ncbi:protein MAIN-LIKE 1-like [Trifolium pratense]|uniref:protein MAIN-LIKE 1-like n=1 Tax=Trifolium pratense TaxID=57577 RepID=UPI001E6980FC|nr:protein MAIN-LIKE 1-like [Trifolium pratense]
MFRDLSTCHTFSWASAALVCLYDNLNDACMFTTKALAGYATLLQCWIHEYFPSLGRRAASGLNCDEPDFPRAMRWIYKQGKTKLPEYRPIMDALTPDDVIWRQFETHRGSIPFDPITLYSGYLRGCTVVPYLPERCIRQFGYVHYVPPPPPLARAYAAIDSDLNGYHASIDRILQPTHPVTYASETTPNYLPWYYTVSHSRLCRPVDGPHGAPLVP